jgi:hypothetical protein
MRLNEIRNFRKVEIIIEDIFSILHCMWLSEITIGILQPTIWTTLICHVHMFMDVNYIK